MTSILKASDAIALQECIDGGGVAVFPTDTVYGVGCDPDNELAVRRLYELKGRPPKRSSAVMFFSLDAALEALDDVSEADRLALSVLLPGPLTLLLSNGAKRYTAACRADPGTLGLRVPRLPANLIVLESIDRPVLQSSANLSGQPDSRSLQDVPESIREGADLVLDGGELRGTPSTVIDLRDLSTQHRWHVLREGALGRAAVEELLRPLG